MEKGQIAFCLARGLNLCFTARCHLSSLDRSSQRENDCCPSETFVGPPAVQLQTSDCSQRGVNPGPAGSKRCQSIEASQTPGGTRENLNFRVCLRSMVPQLGNHGKNQTKDFTRRFQQVPDTALPACGRPSASRRRNAGDQPAGSRYLETPMWFLFGSAPVFLPGAKIYDPKRTT